MKKFFVTILAFLYLASVTGANIHLHYCMGVMVSWQLTEKQLPNKCSNCGMTTETSKKGCCEDKYKFIKVEKEHKIVEAGFNLSKTSVAALVNPHCNYPLTYSYKITRELPYSYAPPDKPKVPVYISNCVIRI